MVRPRLIPPSEPTMPAPITSPMPNGDAEDPPVHCVALAAARRIVERLPTTAPDTRVTVMQIEIIAAINEALDRMQSLGGRRVK